MTDLVRLCFAKMMEFWSLRGILRNVAGKL